MAAMTPRERLLAAIRFEGPDRVPVSPRMWRYMLKHDGTQKTEAYLDYVDSHGLDPLLAAVLYPLGFVRAGRSAPFEDTDDVRVTVQEEQKDQVGIVRRRFETPAGVLTDRTRIPPPGKEFGIAPDPHVEEHLIKEHGDLDAFKCLVEAWGKRYGVPDMRAMVDRVGGRGLVAIGAGSALSDNAGAAYPMEKMMIDCYESPAFVHELLDIFQRPIARAMGEGLDRGAEMVYCSSYYESMSAGWSPKLYREFFLPRIKELCDLAHSYGVPYHHYDDGKVRETLPMLREIGVDLVSTIPPPPVGDVTPAQAREIAGRHLCLNGGIDTVNMMWRGTPDQVDAKVKEAIEVAATPEGGYILGTSDSITEQTPVENFEAFFAAARKYGTLA